MWVGVGALVSTAVAILVAYPFGLNATVAAIAIQTLALQLVIMTITAGAIEARFRDLARPLGRILIAAGVMGASIVLVVEAFREIGIGNAWVLVAGTATGAVVFLLLLVRLEPGLITELGGFLHHGRRAPEAHDQVSSGNGGGLVPERNVLR
jgi:hypothetical protein